ncbi:MAG TPA: FHA domain-containing protein [Streptosporangiaceae bacterium]|nr:FHA domain-containing protein [Streptosporangiaceae bacterium]
MTSSPLERLAQTAYEAHRGAHPEPLPAWEDATEQEQKAWRAAVSAVAAQTGKTISEAAQPRSLVIQTGGQRQSFDKDFTVGRQGKLVINDGFASGHHARFRLVRGLWYVEDLGSTNGTSLNGLPIHTTQRLKKGDKIRIGRTVMIVVSA